MAALSTARAQAQSMEDQALRRLAYLLAEWGDTPNRRRFAADVLAWRARLTESQARTLLSMAWELETGLQRKIEAAETHERVMATLREIVGGGK